MMPNQETIRMYRVEPTKNMKMIERLKRLCSTTPKAEMMTMTMDWGCGDERRALVRALIEEALSRGGWKVVWEQRQGWPKFWGLFSFILPGDVQEKVFEPAMAHLLKDYVRRLEYSGKWARAWIHFAFFVRTILLVADCLRAIITHRACTFFKELFLGK